ncbi:hypothetical protein GCK72_010234 [Caenorhabditis remanei]|uniref:Uncharacterized protein n=1 Tax=Caenorhabditis remanei TaxID=31234 RepID=A0A6A5H5F0_CAERE|nr:hypothetical protein GCK72_010234 [Caenorhabditis remanei]KAF1761974.1 hypothetical protein GCK72_010234 [Caenorhabditis remanei]
MTKQLHTGNLIDYDILDYQFKNLQRTEGSSCNSQHNVNSNEKKPLTICNSVFDYEKPSPRGLTRDKESIEKCARKMQPSNNRSMSMIGNPSKIQLNQISEPDASKYNEIKQIPDTMKIEVRRTVVREGGIHFEETSIIQFPKNLPPNVQIITAQFVPGNHDQ